MRVNLIQGSEDWKIWRRGKISASMMPAIMGVSPFKSRNRLWKEVLGIVPEPEFNHHMRRGVELEPVVREIVEQQLNRSFPAACFECDTDPWAVASLDGIDDSGEVIIEIKCPNKPHTSVPEYYFDQIQWQFYCSGAKRCFFCSYTDGNLEIFGVLRDDERIEILRKEALLFLQQVRNLEEPEAAESDCQHLTDEESIRLGMEFDILDNEIKKLEARQNEVRAILVEKAKEGNIRVGQLIVSKVRRPGAIQYDKIPELQGRDLEIFRKPPIESFRITRKK